MRGKPCHVDLSAHLSNTFDALIYFNMNQIFYQVLTDVE